MRKILISVLVLLLLCGVGLGLASCSAEREPAPPIDEVYDRIVEVVEASHEVNVLLFGAGLPIYPRGTAEDELIHRYYGVTDNGQEFVTPYAKYRSIIEMQTAIAAVYRVEYRESLFETLFTGYADQNMSVAMPARFNEDEKSLYQNKYVKSLVDGVRVYDYAKMEIVGYSHASYMRVAIPSYTESHPGEWTTVYLSFVFENGDWYLDSPSC